MDGGALGLAWHLHLKPEDVGKLNEVAASTRLHVLALLPQLEPPYDAALGMLDAWDATPYGDRYEAERERLRSCISERKTSWRAASTFAKLMALHVKTKERTENAQVNPQANPQVNNDPESSVSASSVCDHWTTVDWRSNLGSTAHSGWTIRPSRFEALKHAVRVMDAPSETAPTAHSVEPAAAPSTATDLPPPDPPAASVRCIETTALPSAQPEGVRAGAAAPVAADGQHRT